MIGDYKENIGRVFEFDAKQIDSRDIENENILVSTNHFRSSKMKEIATSSEGTRYGLYFEWVKNAQKIDVAKIQEILSGYRDTRYWETIANNGTIQSVVMIPELRNIFGANGRNIPVTNGEYIEVNY